MQRRAVFGLFLLPLARGQGTCAPTPALTQGPYYLRDVPQREDLREGLPGVPLRLLLRVRDRACRPLEGARVDLWHTDALGRYSGVNAPGTFCRGWQATDERGEVAFLILFPGWYPSRTPHLHLRVEAGGRVFATQLFFPEEDPVLAQEGAHLIFHPFQEAGERLGERLLESLAIMGKVNYGRSQQMGSD